MKKRILASLVFFLIGMGMSSAQDEVDLTILTLPQELKESANMVVRNQEMIVDVIFQSPSVIDQSCAFIAAPYICSDNNIQFPVIEMESISYRNAYLSDIETFRFNSFSSLQKL